MKYQKGFTLGEMLFVLVGILGTVGWIMNIYFLSQSINMENWGICVARAIGVFVPPFGALIGYIPF